MHDEETAARHSVDGTPQSKTWLWALLLAVTMMVAAALLYLFVVREKTVASPTPPALTTTETAAPPTPTISASPREAGTAFFDALPDYVGAYALTAVAENPDWVEAGAFDAYSLTYSDGTEEITLLAGQWRTADGAAEAFVSLGGPDGWPGGTGDLPAGPCPKAPTPDTKSIYLNQTAIFQVDAPDGGAAEFSCRMPM
jgi:hypothetical protein